MDVRDARKLRDIIIDCRHPAALARFWALVLSWPPPVWDANDLADLASRGISDPELDPFVFIDSGAPPLPRIGFQRVPEPKVGKNRLHLDVNVDNMEALDELVTAGASVEQSHIGEGEHDWFVLRDPEGNEFCAAIVG